MPGQPEPAANDRDLLLRAVQDEMSAFEKREAEFRKKDRQERAERLRIPLQADS